MTKAQIKYSLFNCHLTRQKLKISPLLFSRLSETMEVSLFVFLITILIFSTFPQPAALRNPQDPVSSMGPAILPSSSSTASPNPAARPVLQTPLAPALFVIGDSSVDCGTNNFLGTLARADRLPYGRDFDTQQPTGRFSNGRIPVDYLGKDACFLDFLSPCLGSGKKEENKGKIFPFSCLTNVFRLLSRFLSCFLVERESLLFGIVFEGRKITKSTVYSLTKLSGKLEFDFCFRFWI